MHGALGVSNEMPLGGRWMAAPIMGLVDGPTEVHRTTVGRQVLKRYRPVEGSGRASTPHPGGPPPGESSPKYLEHEVGNQ